MKPARRAGIKYIRTKNFPNPDAATAVTTPVQIKVIATNSAQIRRRTLRFCTGEPWRKKERANKKGV